MLALSNADYLLTKTSTTPQIDERIAMKALLSKTPGGPDTLVLGDVPEPNPGNGEIRLAVRACGVNFPDSLIIEDKYQFKPPRPFAPGGEVAGVVDAVGEGVDHGLVGKPMIGFIGHGGMAEKVRARREARYADAGRHVVRDGGRLRHDLRHLDPRP